MKIADQNISTGILRQNILEKANEAFSGSKATEEFSKKINDAINSVADSQNKASKITKDYEHMYLGGASAPKGPQGSQRPFI